jgi:hypothetical protein
MTLRDESIGHTTLPAATGRCLPRLLSCRAIFFAGITALAGCQTTADRIDRRAAEYGFNRTQVSGRGFDHVVYLSSRAERTTNLYFVFIDGDGRPVSVKAQAPNEDPTTRHPLALDLLEATAAPGAYVARPCYELMTAACEPSLWTSDRYSETVVASMVAVIESLQQQRPAGGSLVLVGYSGGGVLAVLVAERLQHVAAVITLSANLDVAAWADIDGYTPLAHSLNPANSERTHPWKELHLQGLEDTVVPPGTTERYFTRYPLAERRAFPNFDHSCCWLSAWPDIAAQFTREGASHSY